MGRELLVPATAVLLLLIACGEGGPDIVESTLVPPAPMSMAAPTPATLAVQAEARRSPYPSMPDSRSRKERLEEFEEAILGLGITSAPTEESYWQQFIDRAFPVPLSEFENLPQGVALIYQEGYTGYMRSSPRVPIYRVFWQDGELARETLFAKDHPIFRSIEPPSFRPWTSVESWQGELAHDDQFRVISTPDGSRMIAVACHRVSCQQDGLGGSTDYDRDILPLPTTDVYESTDGGRTWVHVDTIDLPWFPEAISDDQLLLSSRSFLVPVWVSYILWPSMETAPLPDPYGDGLTFSTALDELVSSIEGSGEVDLPGVLPMIFPGHPAGMPSVVPIAAISLGG